MVPIRSLAVPDTSIHSSRQMPRKRLETQQARVSDSLFDAAVADLHGITGLLRDAATPWSPKAEAYVPGAGWPACGCRKADPAALPVLGGHERVAG
ncbi:MAG: hypothetical protein JWN10_1173 [Solirubrobacterales bacterium]|nr:hypothetical protein [Solirubrobacterales bacterium]